MPFEQLLRSHERLRENLAALEFAAAKLIDGVDEWAIVEDVSNFLARNVKRHEQDETDSLFPRLQNDAQARTLIEELEREHALQNEYASELDELVHDPERHLQTRALFALAHRLGESYAAHLAREEDQLFPLAQTLLTTDALELIASEMRARRNGGVRGAGGGGGGGGRGRNRGPA